MATLYVSYLGGVQNMVGKEPCGSTTVTTSGATAKTSAAAPAEAAIAVVISDAAHYVNVGPQASVEASAANGMYVPANVERHLAINAGDGVAAITV
jgi:uncharacterized RmlC-like cupin family protein